MIIADTNAMEGRTFPAGRTTKHIAGGDSPIKPRQFSLGYVTLQPEGGQVPWHMQEQEELYFVFEGVGEMCLGAERRTLNAGQAVYIPPGIYHQLTNIGPGQLTIIYCYGPPGEVAHWRQELEGTLPRAGAEAPPLPAGARPQRVERPEAS